MYIEYSVEFGLYIHACVKCPSPAIGISVFILGVVGLPSSDIRGNMQEAQFRGARYLIVAVGSDYIFVYIAGMFFLPA